MLLDDLRIAPARRAVELQDQLLLAGSELIDAILVTVQREQPPIGVESERRGALQHDLRRQAGRRSQLCGMPSVSHPCPTKKPSIVVTGGAGYTGSQEAL